MDSFDLIVFGGDGDLSFRKIYPALYHRLNENQISKNDRILSVSRKEYTREGFLKKLETELNLYIPNAFTPFSTNDDLNNIFKAYGIGILNFKMEIFSRWGERIFTSNSIDIGWDGTSINDNQVPVGIYIYLIETENIYGEMFKYNGQVKLIR